MANKLDLQMKALKELKSYIEKLMAATNMVVGELREGRQEDTDELFNMVIQGINWVIEVFNGCESLINETEMLVDKTKMTSAVGRLGTVLQEKDDIKIAACLDVDFMPFLNAMRIAANTITE